jgi:DNA polymerase III delta prime subunit
MKYIVQENIKNLLNGFIDNNKIPNILFHGENGSGKKTILNNFLDEIYKNVENKKNYIMYVNCAHGKGIKFIRDELKFYAKTNLNYKTNVKFKSIILLNADKLTVDAQSALRRCIELFSNTTRFFIVIDNKSRLLKPIISRFCIIYVPKPLVRNKIINLHNLNKIEIVKTIETKKNKRIKELLEKLEEKEIINESLNLYENGISGLDIINYIEKRYKEDIIKYKLLMYFTKIKYNYRNEKLLLTHMLYVYLMRNTIDLENICNM